MPLLGTAAVAMWWDIAPEQRVEFEDWHSHEHLDERIGIPGFLRGSRWASATGGAGFFVMYELDAYETLTSPAYLARLNSPTAWSTKMMPHHRNMVRSLCRVDASEGGGIARSMITVRLSPRTGAATALRQRLRDELSSLARTPGITGAHLLRTEAPAHSMTQEQRIRGGADAAADWIVLVVGYDRQALGAIANGKLSAATDGAKSGMLSAMYDLSHVVRRDEFHGRIGQP